MEKPLLNLYETVQKLIGHHRKLLDAVRLEHEALVQADLKNIQDVTLTKQMLIEALRQTETERLKALGEIAMAWKKPVRDLSLGSIAIAIQGQDPKGAEQFRSTFNALTILVQRITEQNKLNQHLVEKSLEHIQNMKKNILGESVPRSNTYTPQGQKSGGINGARLISKEA